MVAGSSNRWARQRGVSLAAPLQEPWILPPPDTIIGSQIAHAFRAAGFEPPRSRNRILFHSIVSSAGRNRPFHCDVVSMVMLATHPPLKLLRLESPMGARPTGIITLRTGHGAGLKFRDCFSPTAFELVFTYATILQKSAARQALIACILLPAIDPLSDTSVRHITFETHLDNLLLHVLKTIADDRKVPDADRDIAKVLVEIASDRTQAPTARREDDRRVVTDIDAMIRQLEQELKKAFQVRN
jgi:hypothetical protein